MINRMQQFLGDAPEPAAYTDYYELEAVGDTYIVAMSTALAVEQRLDRCGTPVWLEFQDIFGARHRLPAAAVYRISESTRVTRAKLRAFRKAMHDEAREDGDPFADF